MLGAENNPRIQGLSKYLRVLRCYLHTYKEKA